MNSIARLFTVAALAINEVAGQFIPSSSGEPTQLCKFTSKTFTNLLDKREIIVDLNELDPLIEAFAC
jgi:hypothetical protein